MAKAAPVALTVLIVALAGCGGGSKSSSASSAPPASSTPASSTPAAASSAGAHGLQVAADPSGQLRFTKTSLTAKAGKVSIDFVNKSALGHNLTVQRPAGGPNLGATPTFSGGSKVLTLTLKPGRYSFYCSVPGHRQAGMQGTLVVK